MLKSATARPARISPASGEAAGDEECGQDPEPGQKRGDREGLVEPATQRRCRGPLEVPDCLGRQPVL